MQRGQALSAPCSLIQSLAGRLTFEPLQDSIRSAHVGPGAGTVEAWVSGHPAESL